MSLLSKITNYFYPVEDKRPEPKLVTKGKKYHLVLSGGWIRGFAHIGVYKALVEHGYHIASVSGTSMGALVGLFIAGQKTPQEIEDIFCAQSLFKFLDVAFSKEGMLSTKTIQQAINTELKENKIEELPLPFTVCVTDIDAWVPIYYKKWDIKTIVTASCAIPGLFKPIRYDGHYLVDGWVCDNFPVSEHNGLPIIWSHVNPIPKKISHSGQAISVQSLELLVYRDIPKQQQSCELFFEPPKLSTVWQPLFMNPQKIIKIGYDHAMSVLWPLRKKS